MSTRGGMDAYDRKHLKTWLQQSVFSDDRRKVGKIIRSYVRRHPEVIGQSRSWPEILRLAEASGSNPRDVSVLQKKREARERAAQIRQASGRNNPRMVFWDSSINKYTASKFLSKYGNINASGETKAAAVRNLKAAIARAKTGSHNPWHAAGNFTSRADADNRKRQLEQAGHIVRMSVSAKGTSAENYSVYTRKPIGENPAELLIMGANPRVEVVHADNPPVEDIVEDFTGQEVKWLDVYNEPHIPRGRYAQLGPLIALYIKPAKGGQVQRIGGMGENFAAAWNGKPPIIVTDSTARKIYFVDGAQDISANLAAFGAIDKGNGLFELGQGRRIDYQCRKEHVASPEEDLWKHDHGEENGKLPTVLFDTRSKRLLYEGGDYRIEGPWIRN
jgi:hypothetical protein